MSDFDKEAERERLREKYERDQEKREATEKMSDLLLKGATMTNAHCENCGDPIFRYEGQEFCPTCEQVVAEDPETGAAESDGTETDQEADATPSDAAHTDQSEPADGVDASTPAGTGEAVEADTTNGTEAAQASGDAQPASAGETGPGTRQGTTPPGHIEIKSPSGPAGDASGGAASEQPAGEQHSEPERTGGVDPTASGGTAGGQPTPAGAAPGESDADDGLATARESLVRTLVAHSRQAETCDDPRRARDHLAAAREAAEALSALSYR